MTAALSLEAASSKIPDKNPFKSEMLGTFSAPLSSAKSTQIYFSGNISGMRESCGCALSPKGGFERRLNFLKKENLLSKHEDTILLDFGNLLFKSNLFEEKDEKEALKNAAQVVAGTNFFPYSAVNFGSLDRVVAPDKLSRIFADSRFPWVASNVFPPTKFSGRIARRIPIRLKNAEFVVFGLSSRDENIEAHGWRFEEPGAVLAQELKDLPANVFPVILSDIEQAELMPLAASVKRPVLFLGSRETGGWDKPLEVGQSLLVHLRPQGQDWGHLRFSTQQNDRKGWFNPSQAETLAKRWDDLKAEAVAIRKLASSSQKDIELKNIERQMLDLVKLAPSSQDIAYSFETIEMNEAFNAKNEVTPYMK